MTFDEAIKHAEEVVEEQEELYRLCPASESDIFYCDGTKNCKTLENGENKGCQKCAEEHRQLAEWLKDYKRLRQKPCENAISRTDMLDAIGHGATYTSEDLQRIIKDLPPVNPQIKTGRWIKITPSGIYMCSECEQNVLTGDIDAYHYCHHCGIKMVELQESEDKK